MAFHVFNSNMSEAETTKYRRKRQREFALELAKAFKEELLKTLPKIPEDFDGIDLRMLAALVVKDKLTVRSSTRAKRAFNRAVQKHNLP